MRVTQICRLAVKDIDTLIAESREGVKTTDAMLLGSAYHAYILRPDRTGDTPNEVVEIDADNFMTKAAKEAKAAALDAGLIPMLKAKCREIERGVQFLEPALRELFAGKVEYEKEVSGDLAGFGEIVGHIDALAESKIIDLKVSALNRDLNKVVFDSGYQLQMYLYMRLAGVDFADLVFLNPASLTLKVVSMNAFELETECEALLKRAVENYVQLFEIETGGVPYVERLEYQTPQWALSQLIQNEGL